MSDIAGMQYYVNIDPKTKTGGTLLSYYGFPSDNPAYHPVTKQQYDSYWMMNLSLDDAGNIVATPKSQANQ